MDLWTCRCEFSLHQRFCHLLNSHTLPHSTRSSIHQLAAWYKNVLNIEQAYSLWWSHGLAKASWAMAWPWLHGLWPGHGFMGYGPVMASLAMARLGLMGYGPFMASWAIAWPWPHGLWTWPWAYGLWPAHGLMGYSHGPVRALALVPKSFSERSQFGPSALFSNPPMPPTKTRENSD